MSEQTADVLGITRSSGVAGSYAYTARVRYPGELPSMITFVGSVYGPPIVMVTPGGAQVFVARGVLDRIGDKLDPAWVRAFFAD